MNAKYLIENEDGALMVVTLLLLLLITIMGTSSITTSTFEVQISDNEKRYQNDFYAADSGWMQAVLYLDDQDAPPSTVNTSGDIVRNFGDGGQDVLNTDYPDGATDGTVNGVSYWYQVTNLPDESNKTVSGYGPDYRNFAYTATCNANRTQEVEVKLTKVFRVGY
jgi:Tfp pilus assembly protein PilX